MVVELIPLLLHVSLIFFAGLAAFLMPVNNVMVAISSVLLANASASTSASPPSFLYSPPIDHTVLICLVHSGVFYTRFVLSASRLPPTSNDSLGEPEPAGKSNRRALESPGATKRATAHKAFRHAFRRRAVASPDKPRVRALEQILIAGAQFHMRGPGMLPDEDVGITSSAPRTPDVMYSVPGPKRGRKLTGRPVTSRRPGTLRTRPAGRVTAGTLGT
ncbi:hypothetical protein FB451DRAFT_1184204 [Mycena latifolia]|nr:hypothetical protein FB451DRAFT_1184204 [Mycena latifolia]